jgi:hypothetical protein
VVRRLRRRRLQRRRQGLRRRLYPGRPSLTLVI